MKWVCKKPRRYCEKCKHHRRDLEKEEDSREISYSCFYIQDRVNEYIKEYPIKMIGDDICQVNGEFYEVKSIEEANDIYKKYVTWLIEEELVQY